MPTLPIELKDTYVSVTRPIATAVARDIIRLNGMAPNTPIIFGGATGVVKLPGSAIDDTGPITPPTQTRNAITIEVTEDYIIDTIKTSYAISDVNKLSIADPILGIALAPSYSAIEVELQVTAKFEDRPTAELWRNKFRRKSAQGRNNHYHDLSYHWDIPDSVIVILMEIYKCREAITGYGDTIEQWISSIIGDSVTTLTNQAGQQAMLAVAETQARVLGWYSFDGQPDEAQYDKSANTWTTSFTYRFRYDKPMSCTFTFPPVVHNQIIDPRFLPLETPYDPTAPNAIGNLFTVANEGTTSQFLASINQHYPGYSFPYWDNWAPHIQERGLMDLIRTILLVDVTQPNLVIDCFDLGPFSFISEAIPYLTGGGRAWSLTKLGESVYNFTLYEFKDLVDQSTLTTTDQLRVLSNDPLNTRIAYHGVLKIVTDLSILSPDALRWLALNGNFAVLYLKAIYPNINPDWISAQLNSAGNFNFNAFDDLIAATYGLNMAVGSTHVLNALINVTRSSDNAAT